MCCNNANWTPKANHAKCLGIAVLVFGIIDCLSFVVGGWLAGVGAILAIIGSSIIICCGPAAPAPGSGCKFKAAGVLSLIAGILHLVGAILMIMIVAGTGGTVNQACLDGVCGSGSYATTYCGNALCTSESQCRGDSTIVSGCEDVGTVAAAWVNIVLWPMIIVTIAQLALEIAFAINSSQAAGTMDALSEPPKLAGPAM